MGVHAAGDGIAWDSLEALDVDQPHGLDYRESVHMAKAIRLRLSQEHVTFADATVGGIHKPGGAAVLGICDGTPGAADGTYRGHGIVWDNTACLWCSTAVAGASTSGDFTLVLIHPDKQWGGGDVTWAGAHQFDGSVDMTNAIASGSFCVVGPFLCSSTAEISQRLSCYTGVDITGFLNCASSAYFTDDVSCKADMVVDGTAVFTTNVDVSGDCDITGTLSLATGNVYDTSWFEVEENQTYTKAHSLGSKLLQITMFCCTKGGADYTNARTMPNGMIDGDGARKEGGSVADISTTNFTVYTGTNYALPLSPYTDLWDATGYYRVLATRLI